MKSFLLSALLICTGFAAHAQFPGLPPEIGGIIGGIIGKPGKSTTYSERITVNAQDSSQCEPIALKRAEEKALNRCNQERNVPVVDRKKSCKVRSSSIVDSGFDGSVGQPEVFHHRVKNSSEQAARATLEGEIETYAVSNCQKRTGLRCRVQGQMNFGGCVREKEFMVHGKKQWVCSGSITVVTEASNQGAFYCTAEAVASR